MTFVMSKTQRMAPLDDDDAFAEWYVEEFMKVHVADMYFDLSAAGKREMVLNGRAYARQFGFADTDSQAHFITLMWKIGANFFEHDGFRDIAQDMRLSGAQKIDAFYDVPKEQAVHAIMHPDERYWYPDLLLPEAPE